MAAGVREYLVGGSIGNSADVHSGGDWTQIAELHLSESCAVKVISGFAPLGLDTNPPTAPGIPKIHVRIRYGVAGSTAKIVTIAGNPKVVSGSDFYVEAKMFYSDDGALPSLAADNIIMHVFAGFADGVGQDLQPTRWYRSAFGGGPPQTLVGAVQTAQVGPGKIRQVKGYNDSANPTWIMFFDWPIPGHAPNSVPNQSQLPILIVPVPGTPGSPGVDPFFSDDEIESMVPFTYGLTWQTSSTGNVYTPDATGSVRVEVELYQGEEFGQ